MAIVNKELISKMRPSDIKHYYRQDGHFFDRGTMKFFGDKMGNFGAYTDDNGDRILYRKKAVKNGLIGNGWRVVALNKSEIDLESIRD